jgi:hypothetical protein
MALNIMGLGEEFKPVMHMLLKHKKRMRSSLHIPYEK